MIARAVFTSCSGTRQEIDNDTRRQQKPHPQRGAAAALQVSRHDARDGADAELQQNPDGPNGIPIALLLDDCQEEHLFPMAEGNVDMDERRAGGLQAALSVMCLFYSAGHMPQCVRIAEYKRNKGGADVAHYRKGMLRCP